MMLQKLGGDLLVSPKLGERRTDGDRESAANHFES